MGEVVYGVFNRDVSEGNAARASTHKAQRASDPMEHPLKALEQSFASRTRVLGELASLLADPHVEPEKAGPLFTALVALQATGHKIGLSLADARTNDNAFLSVQKELETWIRDVDTFEKRVLTETNHEVIDTVGEDLRAPTRSEPTLAAPRKFPVVWLGAGMLALGSLTWIAVSAFNKKPRRKKEPEEKFKKVKLRRALPAR